MQPAVRSSIHLLLLLGRRRRLVGHANAPTGCHCWPGADCSLQKSQLRAAWNSRRGQEANDYIIVEPIVAGLGSSSSQISRLEARSSELERPAPT